MALLPLSRRLIKIFHPEGIPLPGTWLYNLISRSNIFQHHYEIIARDINSYCSKGRILDIGTGPGWLLIKLHELSPDSELTGIDISASMVAKAQKNISATGSSGSIQIMKADVIRLPFDDASFDLITSTGSVHHWKEPVKGLNEIHRILKPGGSALLYDLVTDTPTSILNDTAHRFGRLRLLMFWLHSFEEPFYSRNSLEEMARASLFKQGETKFTGLLCCLFIQKS